jgi:hypothetical protein
MPEVSDEETGEGQAYGEPRIAPAFQSDIFLIMWRSTRLGGTYSTVRKSRESMERFLHALDMMGFDMQNVQVSQQTKPWVPVRKTKPKKEQPNHE